jgi:acyl transferase domain-containing protein/nucleoside-diphosphate-sugar epimerase/acyl carrier protein
VASLDVAIVGMACRLPGGVTDLDGVAAALSDVHDRLGPVPSSRQAVGEWAGVPPRGGFVDDDVWASFDAERFGLSAAEAIRLEPRQRLLLTLCWEALESAHAPPDTLVGDAVGVYLGLGPSDWGRQAFADGAARDAYSGTGHFASVAAGRLSYALGAVGPALVVQTACSSSLVALQLACRDLAAGRVARALVGGVNVVVRPEPSLYFARLGALSPSGTCRPFDARADGYVRAEGGVMLALRTVESARAAGDRILGVVHGVGVNHDGRTNGLTAPSARAQEAVIRSALEDAGASPGDVAHIEAHGTGTPLGDPVELAALSRVFGTAGVTVHATKARFGHLECAAGVTGVVAALATLRTGVAPAVLNLETPNPRATATGLTLVGTPTPLRPGLVGVSSFGLSGTNAHVILGAGSDLPARAAPALRPALGSGWSAETMRPVPPDAESALTSRVAVAHGPWRRVGAGAAVRAARRPELVFVTREGDDPTEALAWLAVHGVEPEEVVELAVSAAGEDPASIETTVVAQRTRRNTVWLALQVPRFTEGGPRWVAFTPSDACLSALWQHGVSVEWGDELRARAVLPPVPTPSHPRWPLRPDDKDAPYTGWRIEWRPAPAPAPLATAGWTTPELGLSLPKAAAPRAGGTWVVRDPGGSLSERIVQLSERLRAAAAVGARLVVVTRGATPVTGDRDAEAAGVWGWAAAAGMDLPAVFGGVVDLGEDTDPTGVLGLDEARVALGPDGPMVPRLVADDAQPPLARVRGTWLVLGGTGALGGACVRYLQARGAEHVVVVSRTAGPTLPGADRIAVDPTDAVAQCVALAPLGPVAGLVHAAGAAPRDTADDPIWAATVDDRLRMAEAADRWLPGTAVRLVITSVSGVWGGRRLASYAAASARLEGWVRSRRAAGVPWQSLCLGPWGEGGLVSSEEREAFERAGVLTVDRESLHSGLDTALGLGGDRVVAPLDVSRLVATLGTPWARLFGELGHAESVEVPLMGADRLRAVVVEEVRAVLGGDVDPTAGFFDAGMDSIRAVALAERLERALGRAVPATVAFDHPNVDALVRHLAGEQTAAAVVGTDGAAVSIVGAAIRFPGADDLSSLARVLAGADDTLGPVPADRWDASEHQAPRAGFVAGLEDFDPEAFRISPREAVALDPQQRLLLELSREAIARAGMSLSALRSLRVGVFVGVGRSEYWDRLRGGGDHYAWSGTGNATAFSAGRIAHVLGLDGPAIAVDTACSSSLVALHLAVRSLRSGECGAALVGGANALLSPESFRYLEAIGALSPTGRCRPFDAAADGYARSEGAGVVLLVRDAAGLDVLAEVRGTAVGHDGPAAGLTVPNGPAQERVIRAALADAGLHPGDVDAIEAHGTGTPLGDPIEVGALARVFGERARPLVVSAAKSRLGHLEAGAGMVGVAAALVALERGAANAGVGTVNPRLALDWPISFIGGPAAVVGVSSFGMSGTNAHVVLSAPPPVAAADVDSLPVLLRAASAHRPAQARALLDRLDAHPNPLRAAATAARWDAESARIARVGQREFVGTARPLRVGFLCTGQGSQSPAMARPLYDAVPAFRDALDRLADQVPEVGLRRLLLDPTVDLDDTAAAQPALVALSVVLGELLSGLGVQATVVCGHSIGEVAAAALAGVLSPADAVRLAARRGRLMADTASGGVMVAVRAAPQRIQLAEGAAIAAVNAPDEIVVSGPAAAVEASLANIDAPRTPLRVSHAFHAPGMDGVVEPLAAFVETLVLSRPGLTVLSPADGGRVDAALTEPAWWGRQARATVLFADAVRAAPVDVWVELGARPILTALAARNGAECLTLIAPDALPWTTLLSALADLWTRGVPVDLLEVHPTTPPLHLAPAPLERRRLWVESVVAPSPRWTVRWVPVGPPSDRAVVDVRASDPAAAVLEALQAVGSGARVLRVADEPSDPAAAAVQALVATLSVERADLGVAVVAGPGGAPPVGVDQARVRDGVVEVARLERLADGAPNPWRGRWLVTGGRGSLGGHVARHLRAGGAEVLTCGRTPAEAADHHVLDVADPVAVRALLAEHGPFAGVIHCAGAAVDALTRDLSHAVLAQAFAAKVGGAHALNAAHPGELIVFGSATAWFGRAGQAAYAAANAAVEAVVRGRRAAGRPGVCLAWGPWGEGMAAGLATEGERRLATRAALAALDRCLDGPPVQLVFDADWETFAARWVVRPQLLIELAPEAAPDVEVDVASAVREEVARVLGRDTDLGDDAGFFDAGLDSVMAVELARRLSARLGRPLSATLAFDHPRIDQLVAFLEGAVEVGEAVGGASRGAAIAIVGAACRFPGGVESPEELWELLGSGRVPVTGVPEDRFDATELPESARHGAFLTDIDLFDPETFGIAPREAASIDPQHRLLLEVCHGALERSTIRIPARTGIYAGIADRGYLRRFARDGQPFYPDGWAGTGNEASFAAGRVAHALGLEGPAVSLNTTCSSSLVAVDLAVRALRDGTCDAAVAAGVHLILDGESSRYLAGLGALSPTGRCHTFDAAADGYVRADGCAAVVLKRLEDAERDGDPILAVVRGTATNHDGRSSGLTVPSGRAQERVIRAAWADAGMDPSTCTLLQAHGTGTVLGDPIEVRAARAVFVADARPEPLYVRAVKAHLGHAELAAGVAGLLDAVLCLQHREVPRLPGLHTPNPELELDGLQLRGGSLGAGPSRAGVSAFGLSGTNAHVVLESAPARGSTEEPRGPFLLPLSAPTEAGVSALALALPSAGAAVAAGLARRAPHSVRAARIFGATTPLVPIHALPRPRVAFVFTGQGSQRAAMGSGLYARYPVYRAALDDCARALAPWLDLRTVLQDDVALRDTRNTQPALFALGWSLAALLRSWGVVPDVVAGHSVGEWTAAAVAGALDLESACAGIAQRGALMSELEGGGAMLAVHAGLDAVAGVLGEGVEVAAVNHPGETVLTGEADAVATARATIEASGHRCTPLRVSHAFHSARMQPMLDRWEAVVGGLPWQVPHTPVFSALTGQLEGAALASSAFWRRHAREPVRWSDTVRALAEHGVDAYLELGPHPVLTSSGPAVVDDGLWRGTLRRGGDDVTEIFTAVGAMWALGVPVDLEGLQPRVDRIPLPAAPLRREHHWLPGDHAAAPAWTYAEVWEAVPARAAAPSDRVVLGAPELADAFGAAAATAAMTGEVVDARWTAVGSPLELDTAVAAVLALARTADRLWVVVRDSQTDPFQAALWGLARCVFVERPGLRGGVVDLAGGPPTLPAQEAVRITAEGWFAPRLDRRPLAVDAPSIPPTWLVTGGTGTVGQAAARWLSAHGATTLHLVGRRPLTVDADDDRNRLAVELPGVVLHAADVSDRDAVTRLLSGLDGPIGIFHAAGVTHPQAIDAADAETIRRTLAPKVAGAWWLHTLSSELDVQAFVCTGSIAAAWGSRDLCAYAAANRFLDGLAERRVADGLPATTVSFGPWSGGLMNADGLALLARMGQQPLPADRSLRLTGALMAAGHARGVVARVDWSQFAPIYDSSGPRDYLDRLRPHATVVSPAVDAPRLADLRPEQLEARVRSALLNRAGEVLRLDTVPMDRPLIELGFDSLMATELKNVLLADGVDVPLGRLLGGPSLDELVAMTLPRMAPAPSPADALADDDGDVPAWMVWSHLAAAIVGAAVSAGIGYLLLGLLG